MMIYGQQQTSPWLFAQLRADPNTSAAFAGRRLELLRNANWPGSTVKQRA
ncbi:hypothetical protein FAIPA1_30316 [Frankia sp. AiPs1]